MKVKKTEVKLMLESYRTIQKDGQAELEIKKNHALFVH